MGTPVFAVPVLDALTESGVNVVGVVTQPEKPAGRGGRNRPHSSPIQSGISRGKQSAVGSRAAALGIPVFTPKGLRKEENRAFLRELKPDLIVVVAYGKILPKEVLDLPTFGAVNVHFSLLSRWRGPAPVPAAILAGDAETGVTIMKLDEGMDTGPLLAQERVPIRDEDTAATLLPRLADIGARLLAPTLTRYIAWSLSPAPRSLGEVGPTPQDETRASVCPMLKKEDGLIYWTNPAAHIARMVRAYTPWPRTSAMWEGQRLLILRATQRPADPHRAGSHAPPGVVVILPGGVAVATGEGLLELHEVQREGRKPMPIMDFVHGYPRFVGSALGHPARERVVIASGEPARPRGQ